MAGVWISSFAFDSDTELFPIVDGVLFSTQQEGKLLLPVVLPTPKSA
jgi:hypothetical protein